MKTRPGQILSPIQFATKLYRASNFSPQAPRVVAEAYRAVLGLTESACPDAEAIDRLLNPARNLYRLETLNIGVHAPIMRALQHANFTFAKKISHTADSQDQRHRMVPGSRPLLMLTDTRSPDFVIPMLIAGNARAREVYEHAMADAWSAKNELLDRGAPREIALYLLPNAKAIRLVETGSLLHLVHKWTMRTCFNAQEEIFLASMDEIERHAIEATLDYTSGDKTRAARLLNIGRKTIYRKLEHYNSQQKPSESSDD